MAHQIEPVQRAALPPSRGIGANKRPGVLQRGVARGLPFATLYLASLLLVVTLPVFAWLLVLGATGENTAPSVAAPLWYLLGAGALAWLVGRLCRRQGFLIVAGVSVAPMLLAYLALLRISPITATFASEEPSLLSWGASGIGHLLAGPAAFPSDYALLAFTVYVWCWCANDGARLPAYQRTTRRFFWGLAATLCAAVVTLAIPATWRPAIVADLMLLLPVFLVAGPLSLTLTRIAYERDISDADPIFRTSQWRQISYAATLAVAFAAVAVVIASVADPQVIAAFFVRLGVAQPASAVFHALQQALGSLLDLIARWFGLHTAHIQPVPVHYSDPSNQMCIKHPKLLQCQSKRPTKLPVSYLPLLIGLAALLAMCGALAAVIRSRGTHSQRRERAERVEERESLGALRILRQQLRDMVRPHARSASAPSHGEGDTVRTLYRDVLRTAATRRLARAADETPYEYAARLQVAPPFTHSDTDGDDDLMALSDAYAEARYAEREAAPADVLALRERVRRLKGAFMQRPREHGGS